MAFKGGRFVCDQRRTSISGVGRWRRMMGRCPFSGGWRLLPMWSMTSIEERLLELLDDYQPRQLIIAGDAPAPAKRTLRRDRAGRQPRSGRGTHDRLFPALGDTGFCFPPRRLRGAGPERIQIIGHHHPAGTLSDGAGLRLKLPAFSPWAGGVAWPDDGASPICSARHAASCGGTETKPWRPPIPSCNAGNALP